MFISLSYSRKFAGFSEGLRVSHFYIGEGVRKSEGNKTA
jgi:hypothetical protein